MGNRSHKYVFAKDQQSRDKSQVIAYEDYKKCYEKVATDPNYLVNLLHENQTLASRILEFFPSSTRSYEDFLQMVFYMKSYDHVMEHNEYAKYNASKTNVLQRFFMLLVKAPRYELLEQCILNANQMEDLFLQIMKLFLPDPQKGFIIKLIQFIQIKDMQQTTLKQFSLALKHHLPQIEKHIENYFTQKFRYMIKDGYLLKFFKSQIMYEDAVILAMMLSEITKPSTTLLYEPTTFGSSFTALQKNIIGYTGPWLLLIQHAEKSLTNDNQYVIYRLGSFQSGPILDVNGFQGDVQGFLFTAEPKMKFLIPANESGKNFFFVNNMQDKLGGGRQGIGFGGDDHKQNFKLWIDQDFDKSTVFNGHDNTYGFGSLIGPSTTQLNIIKLQIWGLGSEQDQLNQEQYWDDRNIEIEKRRKVNKAELLQGGGVGMILQKTFAHREQVYGEMPVNKFETKEGQAQINAMKEPEITERKAPVIDNSRKVITYGSSPGTNYPHNKVQKMQNISNAANNQSKQAVSSTVTNASEQKPMPIMEQNKQMPMMQDSKEVRYQNRTIAQQNMSNINSNNAQFTNDNQLNTNTNQYSQQNNNNTINTINNNTINTNNNNTINTNNNNNYNEQQQQILQQQRYQQQQQQQMAQQQFSNSPQPNYNNSNNSRREDKLKQEQNYNVRQQSTIPPPQQKDIIPREFRQTQQTIAQLQQQGKYIPQSPNYAHNQQNTQYTQQQYQNTQQQYQNTQHAQQQYKNPMGHTQQYNSNVGQNYNIQQKPTVTFNNQPITNPTNPNYYNYSNSKYDNSGWQQPLINAQNTQTQGVNYSPNQGYNHTNPQNHTQPNQQLSTANVSQNYTQPTTTTNYTQPTANYTQPTNTNYTQPTNTNYTQPTTNYTQPTTNYTQPNQPLPSSSNQQNYGQSSQQQY